MQFWNFLAIRLLQTVVVVFIVASVVFFVSRLVGNPESFLLPFDATNEEIETVREHFGLNDPVIVQYGDFLWDLAQLDFGQSYRGGGTSTIGAIGERAVNTLKLTSAALVFAVSLSIPLGVRGGAEAWQADGLVDPLPRRVRAGDAQLLAGPDGDLLLRRGTGVVPHRRGQGVQVADSCQRCRWGCWRWRRSCV